MLLLDTSGLLCYVHKSEPQHQQAVQLLNAATQSLTHSYVLAELLERQDKTYSLCDAVSFVLMRQRNISEALTTDHHFEQEGFRQLLPS